MLIKRCLRGAKSELAGCTTFSSTDSYLPCLALTHQLLLRVAEQQYSKDNSSLAPVVDQFSSRLRGEWWRISTKILWKLTCQVRYNTILISITIHSRSYFCGDNFSCNQSLTFNENLWQADRPDEDFQAFITLELVNGILTTIRTWS